MAQQEDILFITPTIWTRWLDESRRLVSSMFPSSEHLVIDGTERWPYDWFKWIDATRDRPQRWLVHIDEDCFLKSGDELLRLISAMEDEGTTLAAVSDGCHHYRGANAVAVNSFFMVMRSEHIKDLGFDTSSLRLGLTPQGWVNNLGIRFDHGLHARDFQYPFEVMGNGSNTAYEQEPYYMMLWMLKERGRKFRYLYPHFDDYLKSTNPRIEPGSPDIAAHMWFARDWQSGMDVHGLPNHERYRRAAEMLGSSIT